MNAKTKVGFFVIVFDRAERRLVKITPYEHQREAMEALVTAEDAYLNRALNRYEVVLLGAESLEDLHKTHSRYFAHPAADHDYLIAL